MARKSDIAQFTADELARMRADGLSATDWTKAESVTGAEVDAGIAADPDEAGMVMDWDSASIELPERKAVLNMRIDHDVLAYFKQSGRGYQSRINAVLRAFVSAQQRSR